MTTKKHVVKKYRDAYAVFVKGALMPLMTGLSNEDARAWRDWYNENGS